MVRISPRSSFRATCHRRNMKVEFTYAVTVIVEEEVGAKVEDALEAAAKEFYQGADVTETDAVEIEDED